LGPCVVELAGLAYNYGSAPDNEHGADGGITRHIGA